MWIEQSLFKFGIHMTYTYIYISIFASLSVKIQGQKVSSKETQVSLTGHDADENFPSK